MFDLSDPDNEIGDVSSNFPSIDGSEFVFSDIGTKPDDEGEIISATWTYTPGPNDPGITAFTVKYGNQYDLYTGNGTTGSFTLDESGSALSHITFFDTDATPVPTPALLPGLIGMGVATWRKRKGNAEAVNEA